MYVAYRLIRCACVRRALAVRDGVSYSWQIDLPGMPLSWYFKPARQSTTWEHAGVLFATTPGQIAAGGYSRRMLILRFPILVSIALPAILPLIYVLLRYRRVLRRKNQRCTGCGYNLTGNTSGVCPECGVPIEAVAKTLQPS